MLDNLIGLLLNNYEEFPVFEPSVCHNEKPALVPLVIYRDISGYLGRWFYAELILPKSCREIQTNVPEMTVQGIYIDLIIIIIKSMGINV